METLCLPCSLQPQCQLKSITLPTFCRMNHRIINLNMCIAMKRGQKLTLLPCLHLTTLTTSRNKQWNTNLIQIFKNCRKLKANPFPCQQLRILCYTWLINCVINMTVVFGQWPFDIHLCFCFVRKHSLNNSVCTYHPFLHFLLQLAPTLWKQWSLLGPLNQGPGLRSTKARCCS